MTATSPLGILAALVVIGLIVGALILPVSDSERGNNGDVAGEESERGNNGDAAGEEVEPPAKRHVNRKGGYSFSYPEAWRLTRRGATTEVRSPDRVVLVSIGRAPKGNLMKASATFMRSVQRPYRRVQLQAAEVKRIQSHPALLVSGTAINKADVAIRFLAITVGGERNKNYAMAVFTAANSDPAEVVPRVEQIIDSFQPLPQG